MLLGVNLPSFLSVLKMIESNRDTLIIGYVNIRGQTGLQIEKQFQIEDFVKSNNCDILHLQEAFINDDTFSECSFILSNYSVIINNATNKYGTASLVKNDLLGENLMADTEGRVSEYPLECLYNLRNRW